MIHIIKEIIKVMEKPAGPIAGGRPVGPIVRKVIEEDPEVKEVIKVIEEIHKVEEGHKKEEEIIEEDQIHLETDIKRFSNDRVMVNIIMIEDLDHTEDTITGMR